MSNYNDKGLTMDNWHKCPNAIVDRLMGVVLSPSAVCVVLTIWRLTEGVRERHQASIPTETFMRVTGTKRKNTAYQYVNEAVESGLISVQKERGKVSVYSINKKCPLWYNIEVVAEIVPTLQEKEVVTESATSGGKRHIVVAESDIGSDESSGGKRHTYKDIKIKDNIKDIKKEVAKTYSPEKPESVSDQIWSDLLAHRKSKKTSNTKTAWSTIFNALAKTQNATGHTLDQIIAEWISRDWKGFKSDWYINSQPKPTANNNYQGNNHANSHSANQSNQQQPSQQFDTSTSSGYAAQLDADAAAYFARQATERTANPSYQESVSEMEGMVQGENENTW